MLLTSGQTCVSDTTREVSWVLQKWYKIKDSVWDRPKKFGSRIYQIKISVPSEKGTVYLKWALWWKDQEINLEIRIISSFYRRENQVWELLLCTLAGWQQSMGQELQSQCPEPTPVLPCCQSAGQGVVNGPGRGMLWEASPVLRLPISNQSLLLHLHRSKEELTATVFISNNGMYWKYATADTICKCIH